MLKAARRKNISSSWPVLFPGIFWGGGGFTPQNPKFPPPQKSPKFEVFVKKPYKIPPKNLFSPPRTRSLELTLELAAYNTVT